MKKVLILCEDREAPVIIRQLYANPINDCFFTFDSNERYDYLVVLDSIPKPTKVTVEKSHRVLFLGETPFVKRYSSMFRNQFGVVCGCEKNGLYKNIHHMMEIFPWFVGRKYNSDLGKWVVTKSFEDLKRFSSQKREKKICLLSSDKKYTVGHKKRVWFIQQIQKYMPDIKIDVYGNGFTPFDDKYDVLKNYEYSIVIENSSYPDYFTEKILDCYLMGCYPIYYGCKEIHNYFSRDSMTLIDINNVQDSIETIKYVLDSNLFIKRQDALRESKSRVLYNYNLYNVISQVLSEKSMTEHIESPFSEIIYPNRKSYFDKVRELIARVWGIII